MIKQDQRLKILLIGGTGTISASITALLSEMDTVELSVMNRGNKPLPANVKQIICDVYDHAQMEKLLAKKSFDIVCNFLIYHPDEAKQQIDFFKHKIKQYIFISTVVTYNHEDAVMIDETHAQGNPHSLYGREKAACETLFLQAYKEEGFPVTIVRPSQTYGYERIPLSVKGKSCWSVIERILHDKPVIIHGDGKSTWHCTHTDDFAHNFIQLINNERAIGQAFHNIHPTVVNWDIIYHHLYDYLNKAPQIVHIASDTLALSNAYDLRSSILGDKQYSNVFDITKIQQTIPDCRYAIDIQEGIHRYFTYMKEHPEKQLHDEAFDQWCDHVIDRYANFCEQIKGTF